MRSFSRAKERPGADNPARKTPYERQNLNTASDADMLSLIAATHFESSAPFLSQSLMPRQPSAPSQQVAEPSPTARQPTGCYLVGGALLLYLLLSVLILFTAYLTPWALLGSDRLLTAHLLCAGLGMLGATLSATRKYYRALITERTTRHKNPSAPRLDWSLGWVYYYLTRPILGAVLGALAYTLSFVGVQVLTSPSEVGIGQGGKYLLYATAFFFGFATSHVLDLLEAVARRLLQPPSSTS